jgi:hypothetical protein
LPQRSGEFRDGSGGQHRLQHAFQLLVHGPIGDGELSLAFVRQLENGGSPILQIRTAPTVFEGAEPISQLARTASRYAKPGRQFLDPADLDIGNRGHGFDQHQRQAELTAEAQVQRVLELGLDAPNVTEQPPKVGHWMVPGGLDSIDQVFLNYTSMEL